MIDPHDYDSRKEYLEAMSAEFNMPVSSIVTLGEMHGDGNMGLGEGLVAELYFYMPYLVDKFTALAILALPFYTRQGG